MVVTSRIVNYDDNDEGRHYNDEVGDDGDNHA